MSSFVSIIPSPIIKTTNIIGFRIDKVQVELFSGASIRVITYDAPGNIYEIRTVNLSVDEYNGWKDDDQYIVDIVCSKMGFSQPVATPAVVPVPVEVLSPSVETVPLAVEGVATPVVETVPLAVEGVATPVDETVPLAVEGVATPVIETVPQPVDGLAPEQIV